MRGCSTLAQTGPVSKLRAIGQSSLRARAVLPLRARQMHMHIPLCSGVRPICRTLTALGPQTPQGFGNLVSSKVLTDPKTGASKCAGFVRFSTPEEAARAMKDT